MKMWFTGVRETRWAAEVRVGAASFDWTSPGVRRASRVCLLTLGRHARFTL